MRSAPYTLRPLSLSLSKPEGQEKSGSDAAEEDCAPDDPRELCLGFGVEAVWFGVGV